MNDSSVRRHAAEKEGNTPHLLLLENTVEPSARTVAEKR